MQLSILVSNTHADRGIHALCEAGRRLNGLTPSVATLLLCECCAQMVTVTKVSEGAYVESAEHVGLLREDCPLGFDH